jgi:beta-phosphoglucomutase-like phosphatase (HAD superfamily)
MLLKMDPDRVSVSAEPRRKATSMRRSIASRRAPLVSEPPDPLEGGTRPTPSLDLETISTQWQRALDAADGALAAADRSLAPADLRERRNALIRERREVSGELERLADIAGIRPVPWLAPAPVTNRMLGLPPTARACLFDLEGVLTDSGVLQAHAWGEVFDDLLLRLTETTGWHYIPFDRVADYRDYVDGRSRLEGVHAFLDSRGIHLAEGRPGDAGLADTAWGLANRKGTVLARGLKRRGVAALPGAGRYLQAAARGGLRRAVVAASGNTLSMLELAGLATLVEERVDAAAIRSEGLHSRPAPDMLLAACARLDVEPEEAVTLTHSPAGVAAGLAAGLAVIGVGDGAVGELLQGFGATRLVPSLGALLDARLADAA